MKLAEYLMRAAFAEEDWDTAIVALQNGTGADIGSDCEMIVHKGPQFVNAIIAESGAGMAEWDEYEGFELWDEAHRRPTLITIYKKAAVSAVICK